MGNPAVKYEIIGISGSRVVSYERSGAPNESWMIQWGKKRSCDMVIRYFPSRKGWRVLDIRRAFGSSVVGKLYVIWRGQIRGRNYWPTKEAAIMVAMSRLGCVPPTD